MKIIQKEKDMADKWRILVEIAEGEAIMLKFDHLPTDEEVLNETTRYIENKSQGEVQDFERQVNDIESQIAGLESQIE